MTSQDFQKTELPETPGVYFFRKGKEILYVGKATSLKDRVRSYFSRDLINTRGPFIVSMVEEAESITYEQSDSVLEALIMEAQYIKKLQPKYNSREKDDKSYNYVVITDEKWPRVLAVRGRNALQKSLSYTVKESFGPFPQGTQLKLALKIIRRIFPYRDEKCTPLEIQKEAKSFRLPKACFNRQIGLCPGVCTGDITATDYKKTIRHITLFFEGKKTKLITELEKEMKLAAKQKKFEFAQDIKGKIFALGHIQDVSLIKEEVAQRELIKHDSVYRIEAYDIAHLSGRNTVGVMVVMQNGEFEKNEYRKFKIRGKGGKVTVDDTKNLREVLERRLGHAEWKLPNLIVIDGGVAQYNLAHEVLKERGFNIEIVSVVKDDKHKAREILGKKGKIHAHEREILQINLEAHRFAIAYHKNLRKVPFRIPKNSS